MDKLHSFMPTRIARLLKIKSKALLYPLAAWSLFLILTVLFFAFVSPWYYHSISKIISILHGLIVVYVGQNFFHAIYFDPGSFRSCSFEHRHDELRSREEIQFYTVKTTKFDANLCSTCLIVKPPRTHHCRSCACCIDIMDHHCPWLCNCVGRRNYRFFLRFLFTLIVDLHITFLCSLYMIVALRENLYQANVFIAFTLVICTGLLIGPTGGLLGLHVILVSKNISTFEQVTGKFVELERSPYDQGFLKNWLTVCCTSLIPRFDRYTIENKARVSAIIENNY